MSRILPPPGICHNCGAKYDPESFRVKVNGSGPYLSFLCRKCAKEDGAEIVELSV